MLQEIIFEWLIVIFFAVTPSAPAVLEDFSSKLSSLQIGRFYAVLYSITTLANSLRLTWIYHY